MTGVYIIWLLAVPFIIIKGLFFHKDDPYDL